MEMEGKYNTRNPAVKRLMREAQELANPTRDYSAQPLEDNLFEWHFTVRGPPDTEFDGGIYHGRIILPPEYPMKPPNIIILTPNGRFEINKKICLSISGFHPEAWQPSWSIRTALLAIIGFMPTPGSGTIGSLDYTPEERKMLARKSQDFECYTCGKTNKLLANLTETSQSISEEARKLASQISLKGEDLNKGTRDESATTLPEPIDALASDSVRSLTSAQQQANENSGDKIDGEQQQTSIRTAENILESASIETDIRKRVTETQPESSCTENSLHSTYTAAENAPSQRIISQNCTHDSASMVSQRQTSNIVICLLVVAIAGLLYRRLFLLE